MSWYDDLPASERVSLRDAGRIGATRFEGPDVPNAHDPDCITFCTVEEQGNKCRALHACMECARYAVAAGEAP